LQEDRDTYGTIDTECVIAIFDPSSAPSSESAAVVQITPPLELVKFVYDRFRDAKQVKVYIDVYWTRAYAILSVDECEYVLWHWTRGTAPQWLKEYIRESKTRRAAV
jgi:hypothetical protein